MKIAPIMRAFDTAAGLRATLVHTGQHYDAAMKHAFFEQLHIPEPDVDLGVGSGSHTEQTAQIMLRFEPILDRHRPDAVLVVGDVNSTIACALVAVRKQVPVIHVEAGLRSGDRTMPEEINRILTDQLSDLLFTTEASAAENLAREGIAADKVLFVGNVMIDTLLYNLERATAGAETLAQAGHGAWADHYGLLTLHRPANVDDPVVLRRLLETVIEISGNTPLVFPIHPRTRARIEAAGLGELLRTGRFAQLEPLAYLEMLGLMRSAAFVLTDSGGIQEETTALGVPCVTMRDSTERPITVAEGTNTVVGADRDATLAAVEAIRNGRGKAGRQPALWDGHAAERIVTTIAERFAPARAA